MPLVSVVSILPLELSVPFGSSSWFFCPKRRMRVLGVRARIQIANVIRSVSERREAQVSRSELGLGMGLWG